MPLIIVEIYNKNQKPYRGPLRLYEMSESGSDFSRIQRQTFFLYT